MNNFLLSLLTCGEGWLDNHHSLPASGRLGLYDKWYEFDPIWRFVAIAKTMGLIHSVNDDIDNVSGEQRSERLIYRYNRIYSGYVHHTRFAPIYKSFTYPI